MLCTQIAKRNAEHQKVPKLGVTYFRNHLVMSVGKAFGQYKRKEEGRTSSRPRQSVLTEKGHIDLF